MSSTALTSGLDLPQSRLRLRKGFMGMKGAPGLDVVKESIVDWFDGFGWISLAAMSFTEQLFNQFLRIAILPMLVAAEGYRANFLAMDCCCVSSVLGSIIGYWVGRKWGRTVFIRFKAETFRKNSADNQYGTAGTFIAAFSPIPYKVFGQTAGMGEMKMRPFIIAGLREFEVWTRGTLWDLWPKALDAIW